MTGKENRLDTSETKPLDPKSRWKDRLFIDGFNSVRDSAPNSKRFRTGITNERCTELANEQELHVDHWIELVGVGIGPHHLFDINFNCVKFRKHTDEDILVSPVEFQADMTRDNRTAPQLDFPCSPAKLLSFIDGLGAFCDTAIGMHSFSVPDEFRLAVKSAPVESLLSGAPESAEPPARPLGRQRFQEIEILKAIRELGYDPKSLPIDEKGKDGVKAEVRGSLSRHKWSHGVFNKAWDRLSGTKEIIKPK